eukprot:Amastigsp_a176676_6.p3 type:complete len:176 gc:universal Amastigsp_a176676_6:1149-1676(+)
MSLANSDSSGLHLTATSTIVPVVKSADASKITCLVLPLYSGLGTGAPQTVLGNASRLTLRAGNEPLRSTAASRLCNQSAVSTASGTVRGHHDQLSGACDHGVNVVRIVVPASASSGSRSRYSSFECDHHMSGNFPPFKCINASSSSASSGASTMYRSSAWPISELRTDDVLSIAA